jgi:ABC-type polysaccharide/polyol phosphate export permease
MFFLSPIFYTMDFLGNGIARDVIMMNPLTFLMKFARAAILGGESIASEVFLFLFMTMVMMAVALIVFRKFEPYLAERV